MRTRLFEPPEFQIFYRAFPKKTHRDEAAHAWRKLAPNAELIAVIMADITTRQWPEPQYVMNAATYLNKRRWLDERYAVPSESRTVAGAANALGVAHQRAVEMTPEERHRNQMRLRAIADSIVVKSI